MLIQARQEMIRNVRQADSLSTEKVFIASVAKSSTPAADEKERYVYRIETSIIITIDQARSPRLASAEVV